MYMYVHLNIDVSGVTVPLFWWTDLSFLAVYLH